MLAASASAFSRSDSILYDFSLSISQSVVSSIEISFLVLVTKKCLE